MGVLGPGAVSRVRVSEWTPTKGSNGVRFFSKMMVTLTFIPEVCIKWTASSQVEGICSWLPPTGDPGGGGIVCLFEGPLAWKAVYIFLGRF